MKKKAKKDTGAKTNHKERYYQLLKYMVFITNINKEIWDYKQIAQAYRVRWNIEILFKSWKSGFDMEEIVPEARTHTERIESVLYMMLLYIGWYQTIICVPLLKFLEKEKQQLSVIKLVQWIRENWVRWLKGEITLNMKREIYYFCRYDTRRDRANATIYLEQLFNTYP